MADRMMQLPSLQVTRLTKYTHLRVLCLRLEGNLVIYLFDLNYKDKYQRETTDTIANKQTVSMWGKRDVVSNGVCTSQQNETFYGD